MPLSQCRDDLILFPKASGCTASCLWGRKKQSWLHPPLQQLQLNPLGIEISWDWHSSKGLEVKRKGGKGGGKCLSGVVFHLSKCLASGVEFVPAARGCSMQHLGRGQRAWKAERVKITAGLEEVAVRGTRMDCLSRINSRRGVNPASSG